MRLWIVIWNFEDLFLRSYLLFRYLRYKDCTGYIWVYTIYWVSQVSMTDTTDEGWIWTSSRNEIDLHPLTRNEYVCTWRRRHEKSGQLPSWMFLANNIKEWDMYVLAWVDVDAPTHRHTTSSMSIFSERLVESFLCRQLNSRLNRFWMAGRASAGLSLSYGMGMMYIHGTCAVHVHVHWCVHAAV